MTNPLDPGHYGSEELRAFGFKAVGENVRIARNFVVIGPERMTIGNHVRIDAFTVIVATSGDLILGSYIHIGGGSHLVVAADLFLGDFSGTSQGAKIYTASDDYSGRCLAGPMVRDQ